MTHMKDLRAGHTSLSNWIIYYLCTFSRRLDVLLPFTILIGTIRTLLSFQARNELVALLASGIPLSRLMSPFIIVGLTCAGILYCNFEFFLPRAQPRALFIQENSFGKRHLETEATPIREVLLKDMSRMIYRTYNPVIRQFEDVYWIASLDKIYHMKRLTCETSSPTGAMVDIITRDARGNLNHTASYPTLVLKEMQFDEESLINSITPPRDQSLSMLYSQMRLYGKSMAERAVDIRCNFIYKLVFPLMCLLAIMAPASWCLSFRRHIPHFMIYLLALSGLFCFFLLLQVAFVLGKSQIVTPALALLFPWACAIFLIGKDYLRVYQGNL